MRTQDNDDDEPVHSYVPIDPCQPVIAALRAAMAEHIPRAFIDLETARFEPSIGRAARSVCPEASRHRAIRGRGAAGDSSGPRSSSIASASCTWRRGCGSWSSGTSRSCCVCSLLDWPWIREAYVEQTRVQLPRTTRSSRPNIYQPDEQTLLFLLGELPFITGLYERARAELEDDENLSIDGVKELLLAARERYRADLKRRARKITPHLLRQCLKYVRNLSLIERRFTPDLYTLVIAAKQMAGDQFALHVAETAREYPYTELRRATSRSSSASTAAGCPMATMVRLVSRLPGPPMSWRSCELQRRPERREREEWQMRWNPYSQCSWPPEDKQIEDFRAHVFDRARAVMGADLARTEKFTTSIMDGIDIRDTLRHWYEGRST